MATDFTIKTGDTAPALVGTLKDATGAVVNISTASAVRFIMKLKGSDTALIDRAATVTNASGGVVKYQWQTGDTDVIGTYNGEFEVAWGDGTFETFPNEKYLVIKIITDLGGTVPA